MKKKNILTLFVIFHIALLTLEPVVVYGGIASKVRKGINSYLENDLNINVQEGLKPLTEGVNVMDRKGKIPEVSIRFSTPNPKEGEKITASADVTGISNVKDAYYIWYLKNPNRSDQFILDHVASEDMEVDINHIKAVRAQAELYFDPETLDQPFNGSRNSGNGNFYDDYDAIGDQDEDGFKAPIGGGNATGPKEAFCYMYDVKTGEQFEIAEAGKETTGCPSGYVPRCMMDDRYVQCPVITNGLEGGANAEASSSAGGATTNTETNTSLTGKDGARFRNLSRCLDVGIDVLCVDGQYSCLNSDGELGKNYVYSSATDVLRTQTPTPYCVPKDEESGQLWSDSQENGCPSPKNSWCFEGEAKPEDHAVYEEACGIPYDAERPSYYGSGCYDFLKKEQIKKPGSCDVNTSRDNTKCKKVRRVPIGTGDGSFGIEEEKLYHLNPLTERTTPLAINDEALAMGLGVRDFTWKYQKGDEIGVIVEGTGFEATKHEDATYQTVFALLKPACKNVLQDRGSYTEIVKGKQLKIKVGELKHKNNTSGLNACVVQNNLYVKPGTSEYNALDVSISVGGEIRGSDTQAAVPSGLGLEKTITASAGQVQGGAISQSANLYYEWDIQCNKKSIKEHEDFKNNILSKTKGINLKNLKIIADFPKVCTETGEVDFIVKINEPRSGGKSHFGQSSTTLKIYDIGDNPLKVHKTQIVNETQYKSTDTEICDTGIDKTVCRVMNNEVVAIKAEEFTKGVDVNPGSISWKVDGKEYTCNTNISNECGIRQPDGSYSNESNTDTIILPFTGRDGDFVSVTASMSNVSNNTNQKQQVTRVFRITEPSVSIVPQGDSVNRKVLGVYEDLDDVKYVDISDSIFEIVKGDTATLAADLYPGFLNSDEYDVTYEWYIGEELYSREKIIEYPINNDTRVTVEAVLHMNEKDRWVQNQLFGVLRSETAAQKFTKTIQLHVTENEVEEENITDVIATVSHNTPIYIIFLLKMVLAIAVMLLIPSLVLGLERK